MIIHKKSLWYVVFVIVIALILLYAKGTLLNEHRMEAVPEAGSEQKAPAAQDNETIPSVETVNQNVIDYQGNFFIDYRMERDRLRSQEIELYKEIIESPSAGAEAKKAAQDNILALTQSMNLEMRIEKLLQAKGFADALVLLFKDNKATVIIKGENLSKAQAAQVVEAVSSAAGIAPDKVDVVEKK